MDSQDEYFRARERSAIHSPDFTTEDRDKREEVVHTDLARRL